jgi:tRNA(Ile)-lysidine synthase
MRLTADFLTSGAFARLMAPFAPFENHPVLAVAVSGGRDSLALALLANDWARARSGAIVALIVDHGLRTAAACEAEATREMLARRGIEAAILRWNGAKPTHGLQEAARAARYGLLFEACRERAILHLLVAHHADDQAETVAMRAARGSGADGLAGMAALVEQRHARLLRPLLPVPRAWLTATLEALGIAWIDDPSNADPRFERVRLRTAGEIEPHDETAGDLRAAREGRLARAAVDVLEIDDELALDRASFGRLSVDVKAGLLSRVVQAVGGRDHPPRRERLDRAVGRLCETSMRGKSGKSQDFTLSACRLLLRQAPSSRRLRWIVRPENGKENRRKEGQPLVPAAFFACGGPRPPHVD